MLSRSLVNYIRLHFTSRGGDVEVRGKLERDQFYNNYKHGPGARQTHGIHKQA